MRTLKLLFLFLVIADPACAQIGGGQTNVGGGALVQTFAGVPSGTCSKAALAVNTTNGNLYTCLAGVWTLVSGGGGGTVSSGTVNTIAKYTGTTTVGNSLLDDGLTTANTLTYAGSGGISSAPSGGIGGTVTLPEGTTAMASSGNDVLYADSTAHCVKLSLNNGAFSCISIAGSAAVASTTAVTSSNPTINTDQQLMELSLAAGYLNIAHQPFLIHGAGTYSSTTASSPALTFKIKLCTVSGCGSGTVVTLANIVTTTLNTTALTNATWSLGTTAVTNTTGATGNLVAKGVPGLILDLGAAVSAADAVFADTNTATSSNIDLTAALFVDFTVAQSATGASNSYTQMMGMLGPVAGTGPQGPAGPGGGAYSISKGATSPVTQTGSYVTIWSQANVPALAAGACYTIEFALNTPNTVAFTPEMTVDGTVVTTFSNVGAAYFAQTFEYCNNAGVQNAQTLSFMDGGYNSNNGANAGLTQYSIAPFSTPIAIDWSTSRTIAILTSGTSSTVTGTAFRIRQ